MTTVIFKTHADTLPGVVKHALQSLPQLAHGDTILLAQTLQSLPHGLKQIRYRMTYARAYLDRGNESDQIWGRHWRYLIEGVELKALRRPFNIADLQVSTKNYGRGGPIVYVDEHDEEVLRKGGYFAALNDE